MSNDITLDQEDQQNVYGTKETRQYQQTAVNRFHIALENGFKRILAVAPTGAGKTYQSGLISSHPHTRSLLNIPENRKIKVLFIAHLDRLLRQATKEFSKEVPEVD